MRYPSSSLACNIGEAIGGEGTEGAGAGKARRAASGSPVAAFGMGVLARRGIIAPRPSTAATGWLWHEVQDACRWRLGLAL